MWRLCDNIRDVINTCEDTFHNLSAYVCDWSLDAHKIMHPILSLKLGVANIFLLSLLIPFLLFPTYFSFFFHARKEPRILVISSTTIIVITH